ncbi:MAG: alpha/beta fold hydrolase [Rhodocyclales bacterium]|nr:alpha/beta fold hydrolase [Rhodocyclales bacterium]
MKSRIKEQAHVLGPRQSMVGVLATATPAPAEDTPFVVVLNAGIIHRVGPNRMSVTLARELCAWGFNVLRFDLSGIGDSDPRADGLPPIEAAMADVREALDWLEQSRGARRFILVGLCSGADHSVIYSGSDGRVTGIVLLDPSVPRTRRFYRRHLASRVMNGRTWLSVLTGRHAIWDKLLRRSAPPSPESGNPREAALESPTALAFLENAYRRVVEQGVRILAIFSGAAGREYQLNYREQILDAFPSVNFGASLAIEYVKQSDHTFSFESDRGHMIAVIVDWVRNVAARAIPEPLREVDAIDRQ